VEIPSRIPYVTFPFPNLSKTYCPSECLPALIVLGGIFWLPYSPRWLLEQERDEEALAVIKKLHGNIGHDDTFFRAEFYQMRDQLRFEKSQEKTTWGELFTRKTYRKRLILAILVQAFTQLSGINVINYYQTDLYKGLGMRGHTVTLLAGYISPCAIFETILTEHNSVYGLVGPIANVFCLAFVDSWGRKKTLWITGIAMTVDMALVMGLSGGYDNSDNTTAKGFTIAFIFCFSIMYASFQLTHSATKLPLTVFLVSLQLLPRLQLNPLHLRPRDHVHGHPC
jgi:hypothetical protein